MKQNEKQKSKDISIGSPLSIPHAMEKFCRQQSIGYNIAGKEKNFSAHKASNLPRSQYLCHCAEMNGPS